MVTSGSSVNGTRYNSAGCAALNTSDDTVAVSRPVNQSIKLMTSHVSINLHFIRTPTLQYMYYITLADIMTYSHYMYMYM